MPYRRQRRALFIPQAKQPKPHRPSFVIKDETKKAIAIIALLLVFFLISLSLAESAGSAGEYISLGLKNSLGYAAYIVPLCLTIIVVAFFRADPPRPPVIQIASAILFLISFILIFGLKQSGGALGNFIGEYAYSYLGVSTYAIGFIALIGTFFLSLDLNISLILSFLKWIASMLIKAFSFSRKIATQVEMPSFSSKSVYETREEQETSKDSSLKSDQKTSGILKKKSRSKLEIPLSLLSDSSEEPTSGDIKNNQDKIAKTLSNFGIEIEMGAVNIGPTVTQFTLKPAEGVKLSKIVALQNDLSLALAAHPIRLEAPIPGKSLVGIEVPNQAVATVTLRELLSHDQFKNRASNITIPLGKDVAGNPYYADLGRMPHILIAGATGSGKSVAINSLIVSFIYQNNPDELKFVLVDPKRVEMSMYNEIPYLLTPVIHDTKKTISALRWTVSEMERRYHVLSQSQKRNFDAYNQTAVERLPYIIFIIDELADLMTIAPQEVETAIIRLAQLSRAVGIHLVLATQRPSVNVITGLIKANIPARLAFSVASIVDSRTILDSGGAEKLLGRGDMLFINSELSKPKRLQGAFLTDTEIERVTDFLRDSNSAEYQEDLMGELSTASEQMGYTRVSDEKDDVLLDQAKQVVIQANRASASLLQRRLSVGYARAARLLDLLEEQGIIGPQEGSKPREVLVSKQDDQQFYQEGDDDLYNTGGETKAT